MNSESRLGQASFAQLADESNSSRSSKEDAASAEAVIHWGPFDTGDECDWCELIRDILALANSGGGRIILGAEVKESDVLSNLRRYSDYTFADVHVSASNASDHAAAVIVVGPAIFPLGFARQGGRGESAALDVSQPAAPGFFFRRSGRSEPGTTHDMRTFVERLLRRVRRRWVRNIRRALARPMTLDEGSTRKRTARERIRIERAVLQPVRIVADSNAPALQPQDVDRLFPWRQKDLLRELNARIGQRTLNSYDIQAVRRHHRLDERPEFVFNLPGAGRRYSPALADWMMEQFGRNPEFFQQARVADQAMLRLRRKKPR